MTRNRSYLVGALCAILLLTMPGALFAASPPAMTNYQGVLRNAADEPLSGNYDMVFRFFDAATVGNEVMIDRHLAANAQAVMVDGGLFSVALGSGQVIDGSGPGAYASMADLFRDHSGVWLEVTIGAETLTPRTRVLATGYALNATTAGTAGQLNGQPSSFYLDTSSNSQTKTGTIGFTAADPSRAVAEVTAAPGSLGAITASSSGAFCKFTFGPGGSECYGSSFGGFFQDTTYGAWGYAGYAGHGIWGDGSIGVRGRGEGTSAYGGFFEAPGASSRGLYASGAAYGGYFTSTATGSSGLFSTGPAYGGYFQATATSGIAGRFEQPAIPGTFVNVAYSGYAIWSRSLHGIHHWDHDDGTYAIIGASPYKILGTGSVSFVQNHPDKPDEVVIYHAPESSEVNVYTRGSAKLTGGVARISLDPTFEWTANPDLGLTAHLTPRGEPVPLAVESVTSRELSVRGPRGSNVEFDYWVTGLRIGFEEMPPVSGKEFESPLPLEASGAKVYAAKPGLRAFNALERHRAIGKQLGRGVDPDLRASANLRDRIGMGKPMDDSNQPDVPGQGAARPTSLQPPAEPREADQSPIAQAPALSAELDRTPAEQAAVRTEVRHRLSEFFPTSSSIEAGDVVVDDPDERGSVRRTDRPADRTVVGIALSPVVNGRVEVALASVVEGRVDAAYGAILPGDLLVSSPTPGAAMLATAPAPGTVLGKALEPLESGVETIRVLVMLR